MKPSPFAVRPSRRGRITRRHGLAQGEQPRPRQLRAGAVVVNALAVAMFCLPARAAAPTDVIAVYASVSPAYHRVRLPGGTFKPETYAFGEGGRQGGAQADASIDRLRFIDVARQIAPALAARQFVPCNPRDPARTGLLIMVYWGATVDTAGTSDSAAYQIAEALNPAPQSPPPVPPTGQESGAGMVSDPSCSGFASMGQQAGVIQAAGESAAEESALLTGIANRQRDQQDYENAAVLGFLPELADANSSTSPALAFRRQDVVDAVEEGRYFVVLLAYDFQMLWKHKERRLLWEARFSLRERHQAFDRALALMANSASRYFGADSHGLIQQRVPDSAVTIGNLKILGYAPDGRH